MNTQYYLQLQAAKGVGAAAQRSVLNYIKQHNIRFSDLFAEPLSTWKEAGLNGEQVDSLRAAEKLAETWQSNLEDRGIKIIGCLEPEYPKQLVNVLNGHAPPVLYAWGNLNLLNVPAVGFCGSRKASAPGIEVAEDTVKQVVSRQWTTVSGHAKGIDFTAHKTALEQGGTTVIVIPEGLLGFRVRPELRELVREDNVLVLSEFQPNARWSVVNAMTRNHTICGLSDALIVVQASLEGGTFEAGKFALQVKIPLFVADYSKPDANAPGNSYFIQRGAQPIRRNQATKQANLQGLFDEVSSHYTNLDKPQPAAEQASLFPLDDLK